MQKRIEKQRKYFNSGKTLSIAFRKEALKRLGRAIRLYETEIYEALKQDLNKSRTEAFMCEIGMTLSELSHTLRNMEKWAKKKRVPTPLAQFSAESFTVQEEMFFGLILNDNVFVPV